MVACSFMTVFLDAVSLVYFYHFLSFLQACTSSSLRWLTEYSLPRARDRVLKERSDANLPEPAKLARLQEVQRLAKGLAPHCRLRIKN